MRCPYCMGPLQHHTVSTMNAAAVHHMQELQANNAALLSAVRQLSEEQETTREAVREEVEAEKNQHVEELRKQLALLRQTRQAEQVLARSCPCRQSH